MERKDVSDLFRALLPVGTVEAVRQEYQVFKTVSGDYLVFSPSSRGSASFHMTVVAAEKVEAVAKVMGKGGATTGSLMKEEKLEESFGSDDKIAKRFDLLMALYILAAMGRVEMQKKGGTWSSPSGRKRTRAPEGCIHLSVRCFPYRPRLFFKGVRCYRPEFLGARCPT